MRYNVGPGEMPYNGVALSAVNEPNAVGAAYIGYTLPDAATNLVGGTNVLAAGAGDYSVTDSLRAFEVRDGTPVVVSDAIDFSGPVMALWTAPDGTSVSVITRNLASGKYEAFSVQGSCLQ